MFPKNVLKVKRLSKLLLKLMLIIEHLTAYTNYRYYKEHSKINLKFKNILINFSHKFSDSRYRLCCSNKIFQQKMYIFNNFFDIECIFRHWKINFVSVKQLL